MGDFSDGFVVGFIICLVVFAIIIVSTDMRSEEIISQHGCIEYNKETGEPFWLDDSTEY